MSTTELLMKYKIILSAIVLSVILFSIIYLIIQESPESKNENEENTTVTFLVNGTEPVTFYCEVADTAEEREKGLMFRESLDEDKGMLFIFEETKFACFWMKNTLIPLDIIFIDENNFVINIEKASVQTNVSDDKLTLYCSDREAKWVVEINRGVSEQFNIEKGTIVNIDLANTG